MTLKGTAIAAGKAVLFALAGLAGAIIATENETVGNTVKGLSNSAKEQGRGLYDKLTKKNEEPAAPSTDPEPSAGE